MQITMRRVDDIADIDRTFTPYEDTGFRDYIKDRYEKTMEYLDRTGTSVARSFMDRSRDIYERINSSDALRKTRATIRSAMGVRNKDRIFQAESIDELRSAGYTMQRWLMADPVIRESYHKQRIDGYSDTYVDMNPGDIKEDHYDYRRVANGVFLEEKDEHGEDVFVRTTYQEQLLEGDRELDPEEQFDILNSWDIQRMMFSAGMDSTNRLGGNIG